MTTKLDAANSILRLTGVPDGWKEYSLGEVVRIIGGGTPDRNQSAYWRDGGIPWITPTDLTANSSKYISEGAEHISEIGLRDSNATLIPKGSIIFSTRGTVGNTAIAAAPLTINQSCEVLAPKIEGFSSEFLYYLLNFGMSAFHRLAGGTTFGAITRREIARVRFAFPPPEEQAAIARILDTVDKAIELTRETIDRAQSLKTALLVNAFDRMKVEKRRLGEFTTEVRYGTSQAASKQGWGHPTLRIPNVIGDQLALDDLVYVDLNPEEVARLTLRDGDLLMVRTNGNPSYVGRSVVFKAPDDRAWIYASYLIRVRLNEELLPDYVNIFLSMERGRRELFRRVTTSAGNYNINSNNIRLLTIPVPASRAEQEQIVKIAKTCRAYVGGLQRKLVALTDLKKALMRDLLTGKVRVNNLNLAAVAN
jgi:type I restriction enzyme S subunit